MGNEFSIQYRGRCVRPLVDKSDQSIIRLNSSMRIMGVHPSFIKTVMGPVEITIGLICGNMAGTISTPHDLHGRHVTHMGKTVHRNQNHSLRPSVGIHDLTVQFEGLQIEFTIFIGDPDLLGCTDLPLEARWPEGAELDTDPNRIQ